MNAFPDESQMKRSEDGSEPIRGGSIGFNRILQGFVDAASTDRKPRFNAIIISAFTIFRNNWTMSNNPTMQSLEEDFVKDVNLMLDYYNTYLSLVWNHASENKYCPVIIYFPDYDSLPKEIEREVKGKNESLFKLYKTFLARHGNQDGEVKKLERVRCVWVTAGTSSIYPHKDVVRKFREIVAHPTILYTSGDPICLISHVPLDWYVTARLRGISLLESYTARIRPAAEFRFKLDKEGRVPFYSSVHVALGDGVLIKALASLKQRKEILEEAEKDKWLSRSEEDVLKRVSKITQIPTTTFRRYDFI